MTFSTPPIGYFFDFRQKRDAKMEIISRNVEAKLNTIRKEYDILGGGSDAWEAYLADPRTRSRGSLKHDMSSDQFFDVSPGIAQSGYELTGGFKTYQPGPDGTERDFLYTLNETARLNREAAEMQLKAAEKQLEMAEATPTLPEGME